MTISSIPGKTRLQVAKERVAAYLDSVPTSPTNRYSLWTFQNNGYIPVFHLAQNKSRAEIKSYINGLTAAGDTPLAGTICSAVDELIKYLPNEYHDKRIYLVTDGAENNTDPTDQCFGPYSSTTYDQGLEENSWQWKVRNKVCTGEATTPGPCNGPPPYNLSFIMDVDLLFTEYVPFGPSVDSVTEEKGPSFTSSPASTTTNPDAIFFSGLSAASGGKYTTITPTTPPAQATPQPGDANLDGCVNITDRSLVLQYYGQSVPTGTPVDFNRDNIVNVYDYNTVMQNYGRGCTP